MIVLPLTIPVLIFGVSASYGATDAVAPFFAPFLILAALTLFFAVLGPLAASAALKIRRIDAVDCGQLNDIGGKAKYRP